MASDEGLVGGSHGFTIASLYQQLKEVELMDRRTQQQRFDLYEWRYRLQMGSVNDDGTRNSSLQPSDKFLGEQIKLLADFTKHLDTSRSQLRKAYNICSRPGLRPLRILDLPDEILMKTFRYVKGDESLERYGPDLGGLCVADIKSLRLTCRRLCDTSSHLLIHYLRVDLDPSSVSRLEQVSRHPVISKGVRSVRAYLHFYSSWIANDMQSFADYHAAKLRHDVEMIDQMASLDLDFYGRPKEEVLAAAAKMRAIYKNWDRFALDTSYEPDSEEELCYLKLLERAYFGYQKKFADQEMLREEGTFVRTIAAAFARMPTATKFEMRDDDFDILRRTPNIFAQADDNEAVIQATLSPLRWEEARLHGLGEPPAEMIIQLPVAIYKAGVLLSGLDIEVSPPNDCTILAPIEDDRACLTAAVQNLKEFGFGTRNGEPASFWQARTKDELESLGSLLTAFLDTDSIQRMRLDFNFLWDEQSPPSFSLASIINLRQWPNLESVRLLAVPLHLKELERFVDRLGTSLRYMTVETMYLLSGTWAEGLDILRRARDCDDFEDPRGLEMEELSKEERQKIFGKDYEKGGSYVRSKAELYIRGWRHENPLRQDREMSDVE